MVTATPTELLRWIVVLPFLGALWNLFLGRRLKGSVTLVGPGVLLGAFLVGVKAILDLHALGHDAALRDAVFTWIPASEFTAEAALWLDPLSAIMVMVITGIGFLIHVYSVGYMHDDADVARFFTYLNLFVTAMLILVLADNLLLLFVGWEGVGLCSYLLIGFWYDKEENAIAGKKAFIVNRVGDAGFLLGLFLLVQTVGTVDISSLPQHVDALRTATIGGVPVALAIGLLMFVGATGKSAQIPLYVWLPDAMAGPTPVSALIHAATMVTAGVYLIARMHVLYALAPAALEVVAIIGAFTALLAALIAITQTDIKKVLAYSTVSQLGYMFLGLGVGLPGAALFHVVTHAFFKGLLFLGAGSVIHGMGGEQDMRKMGGLRHHMPLTCLTMLAGTLAISGVPPLSGFFSKDEIIWGAVAGPHAQPWLGVIGYLVAFLTALYMGRLFCMTFLGTLRADEHTKHHLHESPAVMTLPLVVLALLSVGGGFIPIPAIVELVTGHPHGHAHAPLWALVLASGLAFGGLGLAYALYVVAPDAPVRLAANLGALYRLSLDKFRIDELYDRLIVRPLFAAAGFLASTIDQGLIDGAVNGSGSLVSEASRLVRRLQTGNVQHYAFSFLVGVVLLLGWMLR
ncbi:MAG: NADH-quinone oxidoreductase subunit L [bacterium]|nr:NADH-quinone oxidoreductase subunit L [bacterium]